MKGSGGGNYEPRDTALSCTGWRVDNQELRKPPKRKKKRGSRWTSECGDVSLMREKPLEWEQLRGRGSVVAGNANECAVVSS